MLTTVRTDRLLVTRQDPKTRRYQALGELTLRDGQYVFTYYDGAPVELPGLRRGREHMSETLFPVFGERVMSSHRRDHRRAMEQLDLGPDAEPFEVLAVSGGRRTGDTYELTPLPEPGVVDLPFFVHGVRYLTDVERACLDQLTPGQRLRFEPEESNPKNSRALLVASDGTRLGYVPDPLLEVVRRVMAGEHVLQVVRVNLPDAGLHQRLLVRLTGTLPG
ncbi:MAG: hypothetical protein L0H79_14465 [Intrasporangium sp.]|uniref:HIRAN domain-containing protein n=1 Tax=Intrasporangium sp. TaxID=1925024 RepID=UPI0026495C52|nr:HIRAN domain-containing protein [Intrasporangium sp.]MDN5796945.1 hypothetical protein [Intrasporangium sp.]